MKLIRLLFVVFVFCHNTIVHTVKPGRARKHKKIPPKKGQPPVAAKKPTDKAQDSDANDHDTTTGQDSSLSGIDVSYIYTTPDGTRRQVTESEMVKIDPKEPLVTRFKLGDTKGILKIMKQCTAEQLSQPLGDHGTTYLMQAAHKGFFDVVEHLISRNVRINAVNGLNMNALACAIVGKHKGIVQLLINNKLDIHAVTEIKRNMLDIALSAGDRDVFDLLVNQGLKLDPHRSDKHNVTQLMLASRAGFSDTVQDLIQGNADVGAIDELQSTALMHALEYGHQNIVDVLLQAGASTDVTNAKGNTTFVFAIIGGLLSVVQQIYAQDPSIIHVANQNGTMPLEWALLKNRGEIALWLAQSGANRDPIFDPNKFILHVAADTGKLSTVCALLQLRADINGVCPKSGDTPLICAVRSNHSHVVRKLVQDRVDVNARNAKKWSAITYAIARTDNDTAMLLQKNGAEIRDIDRAQMGKLS